MTAEGLPHDLLERYRATYGLGSETDVTLEMIERHWQLERGLAEQLLGARPEERRQLFEQCYTRLYRELPWLNVEGSVDKTSIALDWIDVLGKPPLSVYEVGSGRGTLILALAKLGFRCRGSEITSERGEAAGVAHPYVSWGTTDGVRLDRFEPPESFDAVISRQVIEHLHPDDLRPHLAAALNLLVPGGRYILQTPHHSAGPRDVSRLFGCESARGMHLREYTYREILSVAREVGLTHASAPVRWPVALRKASPAAFKARPSGVYLRYLLAAERLAESLSCRRRQRLLAWARGPLFTPNVFLVFTKPDA